MMPLAYSTKRQPLEEGFEKSCPVILCYEGGAIFSPNDLWGVGGR